MEKEKPLEQYTVKELREMTLALGSISGVSGMKKAELIKAIKEAKGIPVTDVREIETVITLKHRIKSLKDRRETLREAGDRSKIDFLRRKISRLKKRTRRLAQKKVS
jgi:hypothetical protein